MTSSLERTAEPLATAVETDGERVLERIESERVDCLVCASRSASRDGVALLDAVRERAQRLPFVLLDDGGRVEPSTALEAGATDCVRTPITDERAALVARRVRNYGERYRRERQLQTVTEQPSAGADAIERNPGESADAIGCGSGESTDGIGPDSSESTDGIGRDRDEDSTAREDPPSRTVSNPERPTDAKLRALSAAFPDIAMLMDEDGRCLDVYVGPDTESLLIDDPDALVGRTVAEETPPEQAALLMDGIAAALETGEVQTVQYRLEVPAGNRWFESRIAPLEERIDGVRAVGMVVRDVTERKETELALRQQEAHLTQAQSVADIGSWRVDVSESDIEWSDEVYRLFGCDADEPITGDRYVERVHPEDRVLVEREWAAALEGTPFDVEHRIVVDGETKWVRGKAALTFDDGEPAYATGVVQDITDRKRYERRLEFQNQQIEVFNRIIRHDLRNQLNIVAGYASLLKEQVEDGEPIADQIREAADELLAVSDEIREVNRLLGDGTDSRPVRIAELLEDVLESIRGEYPDPEFECEITVAASPWVFERDGLEIALENVIENAIEHNDAARPRVEITAEACAERDDVLVRIADNGPGIPASEREILTGTRERSQLEHTSGLGLWTVHWIVSTVGGELTFETGAADAEATDEDGRGADADGTVVTIRLPCAEPPEQSVRT